MVSNLVKPEGTDNTTSKRSGTTGGTSSIMKYGNALNQNVYMAGIDQSSNEDREATTVPVNNIQLKNINAK